MNHDQNNLKGHKSGHNLIRVESQRLAQMLIDAFGDNAKVGLCFLLATLFKDAVTATVKDFPILCLVGEKATGKTEFAKSLLCYTAGEHTSFNICETSVGFVAQSIGRAGNPLVHFDECDKAVKPPMQKLILQLSDGESVRARKRAMPKDRGVVISGHRMPCPDQVLSARSVVLRFDRDSFAFRAWYDYTLIRDKVYADIKQWSLLLRAMVKGTFPYHFRSASLDLLLADTSKMADKRITHNWAVLLAIYRAVAGYIPLRLDYNELIRLFTKGIIRQSEEYRRAD